MPPAAADAFIAMFTRDNPKVERSAFLLARSSERDDAQVNRIIRAARGRRDSLSMTMESLRKWLDEVTPADGAR